MMMTWLFLMGSALLVWTMPAEFAAEQRGALMILNLQMMAFCFYAVGRGIWFLIKERATVAEIFRDIFNAH